ncbi:hypothetical protein BWI17_02505 [Betaproteobacteria bacterium GR16-43]|nr:hypothetical protein BWI17_02505 [Betaproteobacteria bacterium GR16-43]
MNPSRETIPLFSADISQYCKTLRRLLAESGAQALPSHVALLNLLAKSAGHRNYQALRAAPAVHSPFATQSTGEPVAHPLRIPAGTGLPRTTLRALGHFDTAGRLTRWPTQFAVQQTALWGLWARLPTRRVLTEGEVNQYLEASHAFGDPATLRRELVNARLLWRTRDGREYRKEPRRPEPPAKDFLSALFGLVGRSPGD